MASNTSARCLLVTAMDFGVSPESDRAIIEAFLNGFITGAVVNMYDSNVKEAISLAKRHQLPLGLRLYLPRRTESQLDTASEHNTRNDAACTHSDLSPTMCLNCVETQVRSQIRKFVEMMSLPSHIVGPDCLHLHPEVAEAVSRIMSEEWGIYRITGFDSVCAIEASKPTSEISSAKYSLTDAQEARMLCAKHYKARFVLSPSTCISISTSTSMDDLVDRLDAGLSNLTQHLDSVEVLVRTDYAEVDDSTGRASNVEHTSSSSLSSLQHSMSSVLSKYHFSLSSYLNADLCFSPPVQSRPLKSSLNILLLASLTPFTGNFTTALRLSKLLNSVGHHVFFHNAVLSGSEAVVSVQKSIVMHHIDVAIGIHLLRAGSTLRFCSVPYLMILGGTDVNVSLRNPECMVTIRQVVENSAKIIAFSEDIGRVLLDAFDPTHVSISDHLRIPHLSSKLVHIPQATESTCAEFSLKKSLNISPLQRMVLFPTGLRPVKDPLFLLQSAEFANWLSRLADVVFVIIGPELEPSYTIQVKHAVLRCNEDILRQRSGNPTSFHEESQVPIILHHSIDHQQLKAAIKEAFIVINTSITEGMSNTLLEAMCIGTVLLARRNYGNATLISHDKTGFLFSTVEEFTSLCDKLLTEPHTVERLTTAAKLHIESHHSIEQEAAAYGALLESVCQPPVLT